MDIIEAIRARKSIRRFEPRPVSKETLWEILEIATRAPSAINTQPWKICVIAGEPLEKIKNGNVEMMAAGVQPDPDVPFDMYEGIYKKRQVEVTMQLFRLMGIARDEKQKKTAWSQRGMRFFDAPAAIILSVEKSAYSERTFADVTSLAQTICLTALNYNLGTCINGQSILYPDVVRKHVSIPETDVLSLCVAIGHPDVDFPANKVYTEREPIENNTTWHGFE